MRLTRFVPALALALAALAAPGTSFALRQPDALAGRPQFELFGAAPRDASPRGLVAWDRVPRSAHVAWASFRGEFGASWRASFDARTGVPSRLFGPGVAAPGSLADGGVAKTFAEGVLARHIGLLAPGASPSDFVLVSNVADGGMRTLGFVQLKNGLRVKGGQVSFRFKNDRLFMIGSEALPDVPSVETPTQLSAAAAQAVDKAATEWIMRDFGPAQAGAAGAPLILPVSDEKNELRYSVVVPVDVTTLEIAAKFRVYVELGKSRPVARESLYHYASAPVALHVPERAPVYGPRVDEPALLAKVNVEGALAKTDVAGAVTWVNGTTTPIELFLSGDRAQVTNDTGAEATLVTDLSDTVPFLWDASTEEAIDSQLTSFVHAGKVREYAKSYAPTLTFLNSPVKVTVNIDDICNAFSDGTTINFFNSGSGCENTGRLADVVYHEYGHSIHFHSVIEGVGEFEGALSEGLSDYNAATITGDPATARGFFGTSQELRHLDPAGFEKKWPDDLDGEVHDDGEIIGQTLWDMRKELVTKYGEAEGVTLANHLYWEGMRRAVDIPSMYPEVLAADDDDGDVTNGTPNGCEINRAFGLHGLRATGVESSNLGVSAVNQDGYDVNIALTGLFPTCPEDQIGSGTLSWHDRSDPNRSGEVALTLNGNTLTGKIPTQPANTVVKYSVSVELTGKTVTLPDNPADPEYEFFVGEVVPLYCTTFEKDPTGEGWTHGLESGEMVEGADDWTWGKAKGSAQNGDPSAAFSGQFVFGNDLSIQANFNGLYQPDKVNWAKTPIVDTQGFTNVHLQYRRWLNVEDGEFDQASILGGGTVLWQNFDSNMGDSSNVQHRDKEWRFHDVDLSSTISPDGTVQATFKLASDPGLEFGGWTIDDVCIVAYKEAAPLPCAGAGGCAQGGGGVGGAAGTGGGDAVNPTVDDGCGCSVGSEDTTRGYAALGGLAFAAAAMLRRKRR